MTRMATALIVPARSLVENTGNTRIGVARGVQKALIGKVLGEGGGSSATIASAIQWAMDNGANVISMSLGIDFPGYQASLQASGFRADSRLHARWRVID